MARAERKTTAVVAGGAEFMRSKVDQRHGARGLGPMPHPGD